MGGGVSSDYAKTADIVFYDKNAGKLIVVDKNTFEVSNYPIENYTPIGVVAIPSSHNVYGDGSCGVMSLVKMNTDTPDTGTTSTDDIYWGGNGVDIDTLPNLNQAPYVGMCDAPGDETSTVVGEYNQPYIPSDAFKSSSNAVQCPHDLNSYYDDNSSSDYAAPSPYLTNGRRNPSYYQTTSPSSEANALADFNGKQNTQILCYLATTQADWKTANTIENNNTRGYYPAACCCWRFHTEGTNQGDWYLPAAGELGYVVARRKTINDSISLLTTAYGSSVGSSISNFSSSWSSSECSNGYAREFNFYDGRLVYSDKEYGMSCRAFCRINASGEIV